MLYWDGDYSRFYKNTLHSKPQTSSLECAREHDIKTRRQLYTTTITTNITNITTIVIIIINISLSQKQ